MQAKYAEEGEKKIKQEGKGRRGGEGGGVPVTRYSLKLLILMELPSSLSAKKVIFRKSNPIQTVFISFSTFFLRMILLSFGNMMNF